MKIQYSLRLFTAACLLTVSSLASAVTLPFIVKPVATPDFESQYTPDSRLAIDSANGNGLSSDLFTNDPVPVIYPTHNDSVGDNWLTLVPDTVTYIVYDLGAEYYLTGLHLWNYNEVNGYQPRGIRNTDLTFSTTSAFSGFGPAQSFVFGPATPSATDPGVTQMLIFPVIARWVRFDISSNNGGDHTGIAEVRFIATEIPVPEPSTFALLGLGAIGLAIRTRRRRSS